VAKNCIRPYFLDFPYYAPRRMLKGPPPAYNKVASKFAKNVRKFRSLAGLKMNPFMSAFKNAPRKTHLSEDWDTPSSP